MSGVAGLFNVPSSPEQLAQWAFINASEHRDIIRRIYELTKIALPEYVLDPLNPKDLELWSYQHQLMHNQMNEILGIAGFDIDTFDFEDKSTLEGTIALHANEHLQAANILGTG